ncbi:AraC family transcriptional regulator [Virgibacillus phasianinus]|uniref:AraC family transcriptional regulator n=1 Tax=Virgibacillus phasianinus TaxID=2017483 RepID=A0A220U060_9BACI|nr:AraC family transcriptional regulator [Virgibacillus phasianinus]ASK61459.1 AraC family transcriptional regulator [Virgibacillus phasianinus]
MEGLERLADSIDFIEKNLESNLSIEEAATIACMSKFHYQRMFSMLTGVTVADYIRRRRLTLAAQALTHSNSKVIDIALRFGYETPESFSKAFRKIHGINPSAVRQDSHQLKAFPKLFFQIQLKGDVEMDYRIVEKDAFQVIGKGIRTSIVNGQNHREIPVFWDESNRNGFVDELEKDCGSMGVIGACMEFDATQEKLSYYICAEKNRQETPADWEEKEIPAATWAVFESVGAMPDAIPQTWDRVFSEWFPSTGYEHAGGTELEVYSTKGDTTAEDYRCEIWIPIVKK